MSEAELETPSGFTVTGGLTITDGITVSGGTIDFSGAASSDALTLTDLSASTAAAGTTGLAYDNTTGVFTYTPPDLSTYATTSSLSSYATTSSLSSYATTASLAAVATSGAYADISGTPSLATVATSGAYSDLTGTPTALTNTDGLTEGSTNLYFTNARATSAITGSDLDMGGNKVLFGNMYSAEGNLPSATTYHGMFAHVHGTGKGYFAHAGNWVKLLDETSSTTADLTEGTNLYYTDARARASLSASTAAAGTAGLAYDSSTGQFTLTPPDLSSYLTSASLSGYATTASLATVATSGAYSDLTGTPSLSGYLTDITGEALSDLSDVASTTPTDGQVLTYDTTNGWQPETPASGGASINYLASQVTTAPTGTLSTGTLTLGGSARHGGTLNTNLGTYAGSSETTGTNHIRSIAIGHSARYYGDDNVVIGNAARANNSSGQAVVIGGSNGTFARASNLAVGVGYQVEASGSGAVSVGANALSGGSGSIALGENTDATNQHSMAIGQDAQATANAAVAIGAEATTATANQLMLGKNDTIKGFTSIRVGNTNYSPSNNMDLATKKYVDDNAGGLPSNIALNGTGTATASQYNSIALGNGAQATAAYGIALGGNTSASSSRSICIGEWAITAQEGVAIGTGTGNLYRTKASYQGVAIGYRANAYNNYAVAIGGYSDADGGTYTTALGYATQANGQYAVALGYAAVSSQWQITLGSTNNNSLRCNVTSITSLSDRRDKTEITDLDLGLDFVNAITPKSFYRNERGKYYLPTYTPEQLAADDTLVQSYTFDQAGYDTATQKADKKEFGWIAQDVDAQLPAAHSDARLTYNETDDLQDFDVQRFTAGDMLPIAWKALRELSDKHDQLQSDYDALLARVVALENA
jgi:hypothetical protein